MLSLSQLFAEFRCQYLCHTVIFQFLKIGGICSSNPVSVLSTGCVCPMVGDRRELSILHHIKWHSSLHMIWEECILCPVVSTLGMTSILVKVKWFKLILSRFGTIVEKVSQKQVTNLQCRLATWKLLWKLLWFWGHKNKNVPHSLSPAEEPDIMIQAKCDPCISDPCMNNAECRIDPVEQYVCTCPAGVKGRNCETEVNECEDRPCMNGGSCVDLLGTFRLVMLSCCHYGWGGCLRWLLGVATWGGC